MYSSAIENCAIFTTILVQAAEGAHATEVAEGGQTQVLVYIAAAAAAAAATQCVAGLTRSYCTVLL